LPLRYPLKFIY